ncbi:NOG1 family protein [Methanolobus halotolerans]|uniref:GTP-binding protein n=1 Tax=Methanolobus halotolerans TaxID=2052935 RepID=A0A4E0PWM1_9EURY|nr:NOG1 family protein [Methanolobus halotolerans]TGC08957.1 GTP-binding protein [Methanolobus halotolerans]
MIFEKIHTVQTSDELVDKAFRRATRAMSGKKVTGRETLLKANESMVLTSANILTDNLANIVRRFPTFEDLPPFYYEMADILVGVDELRKSLARIDWASSKIHEIAREYVGKMRRSRDPVSLRKQCFGRLGSIMGSIDKELKFLNEARNKLRKLPDVHNEPTIVVAGYPNIGKSSFVSMATGARPEIASYPFTTKGVSIGHFMVGNDRYQVMDTPGLLDRPMSERNEIELQAITALKHLNAVVLFMIDASETCGYEIHEQTNMLEEVREQFPLPLLVVANKSDLPQFRELDIVDMQMSTATGEGVQEVLGKLIAMVEKSKE